MVHIFKKKIVSSSGSRSYILPLYHSGKFQNLSLVPMEQKKKKVHLPRSPRPQDSDSYVTELSDYSWTNKWDLKDKEY